MKSISSLLILGTLLLSSACGSSGGSNPPSPVIPGHAALSVTVVPNPIQAKHVSGDTYDFPFTVVVRESGGVAVNVDRVSVDVRALGAISVYNQSYGPSEIAALGYPTSIGANRELRYALNPRKEVPDDRLFGGVSADVSVEGTDASGNHVSAKTNVTVTR